MPIFVRAEANKNAVAYNIHLVERCFTQLEALSKVGVIGMVAPYGNSGAGAVTLAVSLLTAAGYTVIQDDIGKTLTIS